jgi:acyl-CoA synthetase (AMP-forming)/AMP-acid ligase II
MLARAIPANINYRYTGQELAHLFGSARLAALIVDAEYAAKAAEVATACPGLRYVLVVGEADPAFPDFGAGVTTAAYGSAATSGRKAFSLENGRSGDDKLLIYTGGTTGLPKGVLWRHEDFYASALAGGNHYGEPRRSVAEVVAAAEAMPAGGYLLTAPLMHGAGTYTLFTAFLLASTVVISRRFDAANVLSLVGSEKCMAVAIVGDAMARPLADELAANSDKYDLSSWYILGSGGALLSDSVRDQIQALRPELYITNRFGASETGTDGEFQRAQTGGQRLAVSPTVCVVDEELRHVGPGGIGRLARAGHVPLGYFGDPQATASTFPVIDGVRWALLGDLARVEDDGSITVLGRGSTCINSGGEKVFPEEVEQALKSHPAVLDAVVAGMPDERFGERVAAVVSLRAGSGPSEADADALREHCRGMLAGYKVPARIKFVPDVVRSPTGKADYRWASAELRRG